MKVYDPASPLMKPFGGKELRFREEYYRFEHEGRGRLRWDSVRVLLTVALDDPKIEPRPWNGYKRPDNIYPVSWIRTYGKGRVFYSLARPHAGDVHDAGDRRALPRRPAVHARRSRRGRRHPNPGRRARVQRPVPSHRGGSRAGACTHTASAGSLDLAASDGIEPRHDSRRRRRTTTSGSAGASALPTAALKPLTFSEALAKADILSVASVEASSTQTVSSEVPKPLDSSAADRRAQRRHLPSARAESAGARLPRRRRRRGRGDAPARSSSSPRRSTRRCSSSPPAPRRSRRSSTRSRTSSASTSRSRAQTDPKALMTRARRARQAARHCRRSRRAGCRRASSRSMAPLVRRGRSVTGCCSIGSNRATLGAAPALERLLPRRVSCRREAALDHDRARPGATEADMVEEL